MAFMRALVAHWFLDVDVQFTLEGDKSPNVDPRRIQEAVIKAVEEVLKNTAHSPVRVTTSMSARIDP